MYRIIFGKEQVPTNSKSTSKFVIKNNEDCGLIRK
jgi:hypothetical protein